VEQQIKELNKKIDVAQAMIRLCENEDFRKAILDGYLSSGILNFGYGIAGCATPEMQAACQREIFVRSHVRAYIDKVIAEGRDAAREVEDILKGSEEVDG
jgi:hypothetical protein